jgi:hypothetical protein
MTSRIEPAAFRIIACFLNLYVASYPLYMGTKFLNTVTAKENEWKTEEVWKDKWTNVNE